MTLAHSFDSLATLPSVDRRSAGSVSGESSRPNDILQLNADDILHVHDSAKALVLLRKAGLLQQFSSCSVQRSAEVRVELDHATHYLIAARYCGKAEGEMSHFAVTCLPKSKCSMEHVRHCVALLLADGDAAGRGGLLIVRKSETRELIRTDLRAESSAYRGWVRTSVELDTQRESTVAERGVARWAMGSSGMHARP